MLGLFAVPIDDQLIGDWSTDLLPPPSLPNNDDNNQNATTNERHIGHRPPREIAGRSIERSGTVRRVIDGPRVADVAAAAAVVVVVSRLFSLASRVVRNLQWD